MEHKGKENVPTMEVVFGDGRVDDFDEVVEQYHLALNEFFKGNPESL